MQRWSAEKILHTNTLLYTLCDVQKVFILENFLGLSSTFSVCMPPKNPSRRESRLDEWACDYFINALLQYECKEINKSTFIFQHEHLCSATPELSASATRPPNVHHAVSTGGDSTLTVGPLQTTQSHFLSKRHEEKKQTV